MKTYYVRYHEYRNMYELVWLSSGEVPADAGWERVTRAEAIRHCIAERARRREDPAFAVYADTYIWPYDMEDDDRYYYGVCGPDDRRYRANGYIIEEVAA